MMVLFMNLEMLGKIVDSLCKNKNLYLLRE